MKRTTAEVNHYPSPAHALELAAQLELTAEQIGAPSAERVNSAAFASAVRRLVRREGQYRLAHLEIHRRMRLVLTEEQIRRYVALRGLAPPQPERSSK